MVHWPRGTAGNQGYLLRKKLFVIFADERMWKLFDIYKCSCESSNWNANAHIEFWIGYSFCRKSAHQSSKFLLILNTSFFLTEKTRDTSFDCRVYRWSFVKKSFEKLPFWINLIQSIRHSVELFHLFKNSKRTIKEILLLYLRLETGSKNA